MPKWQRDKIIRDRSSGKKQGSHSTGSKLVVRGSSRISLSPDKSPPKSHLETGFSPTRKMSRSTPEQELVRLLLLLLACLAVAAGGVAVAHPGSPFYIQCMGCGTRLLLAMFEVVR